MHSEVPPRAPDKIHSRPLKPGDEKYLSGILKRIYNQEFNDKYWSWKYLNNPLGYHFCYCALLDNRIVGFAGAIPYRIKWGDREIIAAQITDLAVEPELRGKKIFKPIQKANLAAIWENAHVCYGFTNKYSYRAYRKNFDHAFRVPRMIKVYNTSALLKKKLPSAMTAEIAGNLGNIGVRVAESMQFTGRPASITVRQINTFDTAVDTFLASVSSGFKILHIRNHHYLNWRYCQHPLYRHALYVAENQEQEIVGVMVLRNEPDDSLHRGIVLEFLAPPDRPDIHHLLLKQANVYFRECGVDIVTCWMFPHSPYYGAFKRHLFMKRKGELIILSNTTTRNESLRKDFREASNWHLSCGDDEAF